MRTLFRPTATPRPPDGSLPPLRRLKASTLRALAARALGPVSSFVLALMLARTLGAAGSGLFFVALTLISGLAIFAKFGLETALLRFVGAAQGHNSAAAVHGVYREALKISLALALLISGLCIALATPLARLLLDDPAQAGLLRLLGVLLVPYSLLGINAAMLKALGRPALGGFYEAAAWPVLTLATAGLAMLFGGTSAPALALAYLAAAVVAAAAAHAALARCLPSAAAAAPRRPRGLYASCLSLTAVELINYALLWVPFVLLPALADATEAGLYNVAHRLAAQLGLLMLVLASITAARFAAHHQRRQHAELRRLAGRTTRALLLFGLPPALVLLLWAEPVLGLFGAEFTGAADVLRILVLGQLINLATGPAGYLLAMTGHERTLRNALLVSMSLMLPLAALLIPPFGAAGAAAAVAIAMALHNLVCSALVAGRLGLPVALALAR